MSSRPMGSPSTRRVLLAVLLLVPVAACRSTGDLLAIVNGTLVDGTGAAPVAEAVLVVRQGRIAAVGPRAVVDIPAGAQVVDARRGTILPGFINAHVHQGYDESHLRAWAKGGVTTVRDLGAGTSTDLFVRRDQLRRDKSCARLVAAGPMVTVPEGYPMVPWGSSGLTVDSPEDAAIKVTRLLDAGADLTKITMESGSTFGRAIPMLSPAEAAAITRTAHARGARVSAHILSARDLAPALDAGVDDLAHMVIDTIPDELLARAVAAGVLWVPTLELWKKVGSGYPQAVRNLRRFLDAGGTVALGTDYAGYSGTFDLGMPVQEIEGMAEAGMSPIEIIVAATRNGARACGLDGELGTLEPGKIADVIVVGGDPLADIHALSRILVVVHEGIVLSSRGN